MERAKTEILPQIDMRLIHCFSKSVPCFWLLLICVAAVDTAAQSTPYLGQTPPGDTKQLFATGIIPTGLTAHGAMHFTADGQEAYWSMIQPYPLPMIILESHVEDDAWTTPAGAPFSGTYEDCGPFLDADGDRLYFKSIRPATPGGVSYNTFWFVQRLETGWSAPQMLGEPFSSASIAWQASITADGDIYFPQSPLPPADWNIYLSRFVNGEYQPIELLGAAVNGPEGEMAPFVASDGSYLVFSALKNGGYGWLDLWISFVDSEGNWGEAINLGPTVNTAGNENYPSVSPDGQYLFWVGPGSGDHAYYWISASVIEDLRPDCCLERVGDANGSGDDTPTIGDVSALIDAKFISATCDGILPCLKEADINQSGGDNPTCEDITIGDVSYLIDYLFITGQSIGLPDCK